MIGNDVVDLNLANVQSNWRRPNFLNKVFTSDEQQMIALADNPDLTVWKLWSRKEAVYKIVNRLERIRKLNPISFACCDDHLYRSQVCYNGNYYFVISEVTCEYIHSIAVASYSEFDNVIKIEKSSIIKCDAMPFYQLGTDLAPASVSHHGAYYFAVGLNLDA